MRRSCPGGLDNFIGIIIIFVLAIKTPQSVIVEHDTAIRAQTHCGRGVVVVIKKKTTWWLLRQRRRQTAGIVRHETVLRPKRGVLGIGSAWGSASVGRGMGLARGRAVGEWPRIGEARARGRGWRRRLTASEGERERESEKILIFPPDTSTESFWWDFSLLSRTSYTYPQNENVLYKRYFTSEPVDRTHKTYAYTGMTHCIYVYIASYFYNRRKWLDRSINTIGWSW